MRSLGFEGDRSRRELEWEDSGLALVGEPSRDGLFVFLAPVLLSSLTLSWERVRRVLYEAGGPKVVSTP